MHVRATTIHADLSRLEDGIAYVRVRIVPVVESLPGSLGLSMIVDHDSGLVTITTAWTSAQARSASDDELVVQRTEVAELLGGGPAASELLELAVLDRVRPAPAGAWSRTTRIRVDPHRVDSAVDSYSASTRHALRQLDGYCSAVLLVDRASGHGAVSVTFDSWDSLVASREPAEAIRAAGTAEIGAEVTDVRESEIVITGIRELIPG